MKEDKILITDKYFYFLHHSIFRCYSNRLSIRKGFLVSDLRDLTVDTQNLSLVAHFVKGDDVLLQIKKETSQEAEKVPSAKESLLNGSMKPNRLSKPKKKLTLNLEGHHDSLEGTVQEIEKWARLTEISKTDSGSQESLFSLL